MNIKSISPFNDDGSLNVIIETSQGSAYKYNYDKELDVFFVKKVLASGMVFPFNFGFIPNTIAEDGDELDVLVLSEEPLLTGTLVKCGVVAILKATQFYGETEKHNDRIIASMHATNKFNSAVMHEILSAEMRKQLEDFCVNYNKAEGKTFTPQEWGDVNQAKKIIRRQSLQPE